jgi:hypothetical protein
MAQMSVKLMLPGVHRKADTVGMIMAQLSMKASIKKWGAEAEYAITKEMKQLHWRDSYKPKHWHGLTKKQKERVLESHIFIKQKRDGKIKAQKVIGGNKQRDYTTKKMVADFMTKPLQGSQFRNLRDYIMGRVRSTKPKHMLARRPTRKLLRRVR